MARYPGAVWRGPVPNQGGAMGPLRLGVFHVMEGTMAGTDSWFHDPKAQVSAHFGVSKTGIVYQWVDTAAVAWAEAAYNGEAISIEHEGHAGDVVTPAQADADVELVRWLESQGLPADRAHWFGHGELGVAGGNHPGCPGAHPHGRPSLGPGPGHHRPQPSTSTSGTDQGAGHGRRSDQRPVPKVYAVSPAGHPLQFFGEATGKWQCVDLTAAVQANNPGSQPFTVQP